MRANTAKKITAKKNYNYDYDEANNTVLTCIYLRGWWIALIESGVSAKSALTAHRRRVRATNVRKL